MADKPKRIILVKGNCENCSKPVGVEVEEPDPVVQTVKEACKCGMTEEERIAKWVSFGAMALFLMILGCCSSNHYFTTQQIKAIKEEYQVRPKVSNEGFMNDGSFRVEQKPKEEKK